MVCTVAVCVISRPSAESGATEPSMNGLQNCRKPSSVCWTDWCIPSSRSLEFWSSGLSGLEATHQSMGGTAFRSERAPELQKAFKRLLDRLVYSFEQVVGILVERLVGARSYQPVDGGTALHARMHGDLDCFEQIDTRIGIL